MISERFPRDSGTGCGRPGSVLSLAVPALLLPQTARPAAVITGAPGGRQDSESSRSQLLASLRRESARAKVLSDPDLLTHVADFVINHSSGTRDIDSLAKLGRWERVCRLWRQVSREGKYWDYLARRFIPCLHDSGEDNGPGVAEDGPLMNGNGYLLEGFGILNFREAMQRIGLPWGPTWRQDDHLRCTAVLEVTNLCPAGETRVVLSALGEASVGPCDDGVVGMAYDTERPLQWYHDSALRGSREDVMRPDPQNRLYMRVLVGRGLKTRFTNLWSDGDAWEDGYDGPSAWLATDFDEDDVIQGLPDGSFKLQSQDFIPVHSLLYPGNEGPRARLDLVVVPAQDGKGLDNPSKAWRITYDVNAFLMLDREDSALRLVRYIVCRVVLDRTIKNMVDRVPTVFTCAFGCRFILQAWRNTRCLATEGSPLLRRVVPSRLHGGRRPHCSRLRTQTTPSQLRGA
jgi:hypothetical protein